jgi:2-polyprenyl-6-hydroxyphenyl methylase/3-demethylubiquinone-9 3-methyltransferase
MAIDNEIYTREATRWRDDAGVLSLLGGFTPPRVRYIDEVVRSRGLDRATLRVLDLGCGGGLMAEEMTSLGYLVTGVDPSAASIEAARAHAAQRGLTIDYRVASGETLPFEDGALDLVYCCDVLEHVDDVDQTIAEVSRVLKPGGVFVYDTVNRTVRSWVVLIWLLQGWETTRLMPPNLHVWRKFIRPGELRSALDRHKLLSREMTGFELSLSPRAIVGLLRRRAKGQISYGELGRRLGEALHPGSSRAIVYGGYALRLK